MNSSLTISLQDGLLDLVQVLGEPGTIIPSAVRQYVVDRCLQRLDAAEAKIATYIHKYGLDYETFNRRVTMDQDYLDRLNQNNPRWEADAIEWAGGYSALNERHTGNEMSMNLQVAIDYGISNTDVLALVDGEWRRWSQPYTTDPDADSVRETLEAGGILLERLPYLAVTGGRHRVLPDALGAVPVIKINEVQAIGRGGQALAGLVASARAETPLLVASAGSGTALIKAQGDTFAHVSGTAVGGGTMLGLARLLLRTMDPVEIEALAERGDRNGADLSLADVITGPIGSLPADATAVNFGRLGRRSFHGEISQEDLAAALVNLVAQTIALVTVNAAKAHGCQRIVLTGHMLDMAYFRDVIGLVGKYYATEMQIPETPGWATALGALHLARVGRE